MSDIVDMETGTSSFLDRTALTRRFEENLEHFLADYGFVLIPFGHPVILQDNSWIRSRLRKIDSKESLSAIMVKFAPDYIVIKETEPKDFFFMDAKASITPVFFQKQIDRIASNYGKDPDLSRNDIGEIEREAWLSYNKMYAAKVVIVIATPYHPNLILAEWVSNIKCMWCLKEPLPGNPIPCNCNDCPIYSANDTAFDVIVNKLAGGSGTPHTNIHFGTLQPFDVFLSQYFGVEVNKEEYQKAMLDFVKTWPLGKPQGTVSWGQYNGAIRQLRTKCPWLRYRIKDKYIEDPWHKDNYPLLLEDQ